MAGKGSGKVWLSVAVGALVPFGSGLAADLPVKAPAPVPAFVDWSGVYVGGHVGYGGGMKDWTDPAVDFTAQGFLAGGQVGINKQIASLVFGVELEGSWADISGSPTFSFGGPGLGGFETVSAHSQIDGMATAAGRVGLAADRWFVFAKGGVTGAWEKHSWSLSLTSNTAMPPVQLSLTENGSEFRWAPMVGFGAEYALGGNWSVKAEYDYIHLGNRSVALSGTATVNGVTFPTSGDSPISQDAIHLIKVGANYHFGSVAVDPVYPPVKAAPGYDWTGAYVGAQGGYGFGHKEWPDFVDPTIPGSGKFDVNGWLAGGNGGFNVQSGVFVFGVEGEWMWTGIKGGQSIVQDFGGVSAHTTIDWLAIASARVGFVAGDRLLVYGKGGVAIASEKHSLTETQTTAGVLTGIADVTAKSVHSGAVAGVGAEYALGGNWSVKGEYDYIKMIPQNFTGVGTQTFVPVGSLQVFQQFSKMNQDLHVFKLGVNYHFNPAPQVVSVRY